MDIEGGEETLIDENPTWFERSDFCSWNLSNHVDTLIEVEVWMRGV